MKKLSEYIRTEGNPLDRESGRVSLLFVTQFSVPPEKAAAEAWVELTKIRLVNDVIESALREMLAQCETPGAVYATLEGRRLIVDCRIPEDVILVHPATMVAIMDGERDRIGRTKKDG